MKNLKLLAALLALTIGLAGCGGSSKGGSRPASSASKNKLDGDGMTASSTQEQEYEEPEDVTYMRLLAGEDEYRACVLYLGGSYEVTTDVQKVLDSQTDLRDLWSFVYDIPQDHWVVAPDGGCDLYCIFPQDPDATLFVYETSLTDDAENPLQRGKQLYYSEDGQPILLLCNISDIAPNTEVELYPSTGEELVFSPFLSGENGHVVEAEGVCDFTIYPEGDDWETTTSPWSLEGNWLETARDTDEGFFETAPADADRMCFLPTDADTEGDQLPLTASYITPYPELNVEEADLFYQEGTPEVPFRSNQEWYATFTGTHGDRYAITLEDEDTLALKVYLDGQPILLLCNISDIAPNTEVELYPSTGEELVFSPFLSGENGHVVEAEGVCDFTIYPEGDDWETTTSPWSLEGNWLETARDTDEGFFETAPADADRMCFLPTDADTEGDQLPLTASYITPYPELNVEEADLFYQEGTPEVPFRSNQEWYATFTGTHGDRYAITLEDEDTLALKVYLDGQESYLSLVNTVYFARQEAMG